MCPPAPPPSQWLTFAPVTNHSAAFFAVSATAVNWLSTAFMFAFVLVTPAVLYTLHFGPRPSIVAASALVLLGNWLRYGGARAGPHGNFGLVMFGQILTGLAQPFVLSAPARYSDLWFTNRGRVAATALATLANPFGAALGQLIVPFWVSSPADIPNMVLWVAIIVCGPPRQKLPLLTYHNPTPLPPPLLLSPLANPAARPAQSSVCSVPSFFIPEAPPTPVAPSSETPKAPLLASLRSVSRSLEVWLILVPFAVYVGFFNSLSTLLAQMLVPYRYTDEEAGIGGALLIVVGLVASAVVSPLVDRNKAYLATVKVNVPLIALCYFVFIWMPATHDVGGLAGPYVVLAVLGAASMSLLPVAVELLVELTHPVSPEVTSTLGWAGGQLLGGSFILISDALRADDAANPPRNMNRALVFHAVVALLIMPMPLFLGCFGRQDRLRLRRVRSDELVAAAAAGGAVAA